ncbi:MAG: fibronectin type III domain-containing protein [Thermoguttaceae bacterium]|nr:fibronectin type III domain-containing protein [Thermoguttaceae bacterium]
MAEDLTYDKDGIARIVNGTVDIGAYEYHTGELSTPVIDQPTASGSTVSVSWSSVDNAVAYQLEYKRSTDSTWTTQIVDGTSTTFTGLRNSLYNIRVKAVASGYYADSDYSSVVDVEVLNRVPTAVDDALVLNGQNAYILDVLANDTDPDEDTLAIQSITQPTYGLAILSDGRIYYLPVGDVTSDSFTYTIEDGFGGTSTATVTITASGVGPINPEENAQPVTQDDSARLNQNGYALIEVLANDSDPDSGPLTILSTTQPTNGAVIISKDDKILYICNGTPLADSFNYTVSDGRGGTSTATVTITAPPAPITGLTLSTDSPVVGTEITTTLDPENATATYQWFADETLIEGAEDSSFVVTEDQIGQTITCVATGTGNFYGTVSASTAMIPVPVAQLDVPANFSVSVYNADVTASWSAVENASSYTLEYKPVDGDFWTSMLEIQGTTATFVGVSGTVYNVRVKANGTGDFADSDYAATITDKATGPVVAINVNKVTVSWVDESPEADAVRYRVAGTEKWTLKKLNAGVTSLTFNAAIGTNYDVEVLLDQQETNVLKGTAVVLDQAKLAAVKPSITDDSFQLNVTNYAAKNLAPNAKQAILTINGTMTTLDIVDQQGTAVLPGGGNVTFENGQFTFTGMASNSQYKVQVSFSDGHSVSKVSGAVSVKTLKAPYLAPVLTSATATSDTSIVVAWEPSVGKNTDTPAQKYTVQYSLDGVKWTNATTAATGTAFTIQKLKGGNLYQVRVLATKDSAFEASEVSDVLEAETLALSKAVLDKTSVTDDAFQMKVTNYTTTNLVTAEALNVVTDKFGTVAIALENGTGLAVFENGMTAEFTNGALTFTNAPSNTALKVQISFTKADCTTALSAAVSVKTIMAAYNKPVLTNAIAISSTSITVEWETVYGKNSTKAAQKYTIQYSTDGAKWTNATTSATGTSFTIQKLKPNTKYLIAVIANKDQWFNASEPSDSLIIRTLDN